MAVTVDSPSGVHSVYVCEIHQHAKLLYAAIPGKTCYKECLLKFACNMSNWEANLNEVEKYLLNLFEENNIDTYDTVNFKQCMQKERNITCELYTGNRDWLREIWYIFNKLRPHHFIAKAHSAYLSGLK